MRGVKTISSQQISNAIHTEVKQSNEQNEYDT